MGDDQGRLAEVADDVGRREGFARTGDAEQGLVPVARLEAFRQLGDSLALVAAWLVVGGKLEFHG